MTISYSTATLNSRWSTMKSTIAGYSASDWVNWCNSGNSANSFQGLDPNIVALISAATLNGMNTSLSVQPWQLMTAAQFDQWLAVNTGSSSNFSQLSYTTLDHLAYGNNHPMADMGNSQNVAATAGLWNNWARASGNSVTNLETSAISAIAQTALNANVLSAMAVSDYYAFLPKMTVAQFNAWLSPNVANFGQLSSQAVNALTQGALSAGFFNQAAAGAVSNFLPFMSRTQFGSWLAGSTSTANGVTSYGFANLSAQALNALAQAGTDQPLEAANLPLGAFSAWLANTSNSFSALSVATLNQLAATTSGVDLLSSVSPSQFNGWLSSNLANFAQLTAQAIVALTPTALSAGFFNQAAAGNEVNFLPNLTQTQFSAWLSTPGNLVTQLSGAVMDALLQSTAIPSPMTALSSNDWSNWQTALANTTTGNPQAGGGGALQIPEPAALNNPQLVPGFDPAMFDLGLQVYGDFNLLVSASLNTIATLNPALLQVPHLDAAVFAAWLGTTASYNGVRFDDIRSLTPAVFNALAASQAQVNPLKAISPAEFLSWVQANTTISPSGVITNGFAALSATALRQMATIPSASDKVSRIHYGQANIPDYMLYASGVITAYNAGTTFTSNNAILQDGYSGHGTVVGALMDANKNPVNLVFADGTIAIYNSMTVAYAGYNPAVNTATDGPAVAQINYANTKAADIYADGAVGAPDFTVASLQFNTSGPFQITGVTFTDGTSGGFQAGTTFTSSTAVLQTSHSGLVVAILVNSGGLPVNVVYADGSLGAYSASSTYSSSSAILQTTAAGNGAVAAILVDSNGVPTNLVFTNGAIAAYSAATLVSNGIAFANNPSPSSLGKACRILCGSTGTPSAVLYSSGVLTRYSAGTTFNSGNALLAQTPDSVDGTVLAVLLDSNNNPVNLVFADGAIAAYSASAAAAAIAANGVNPAANLAADGPAVAAIGDSQGRTIADIYADGAVGAPTVASLHFAASGPFRITGVTYTDGTTGTFQAGTTFTSSTAVLQSGNTGHGHVVGVLMDAKKNPVNLVFADGTIAGYVPMTVAYAGYNPSVNVATDGLQVAQINYANTKVADIYADGAVGAPDYTVASLNFSSSGPFQITGVTYIDGSTGAFRAGTTFTSSTAVLQTSHSGLVVAVLVNSGGLPVNVVYADGSLGAYSASSTYSSSSAILQTTAAGNGAVAAILVDSNGVPTNLVFTNGAIAAYSAAALVSNGVAFASNPSPSSLGKACRILCGSTGTPSAVLYSSGVLTRYSAGTTFNSGNALLAQTPDSVDGTVLAVLLDSNNNPVNLVFADGVIAAYSASAAAAAIAANGVNAAANLAADGPIVAPIVDSQGRTVADIHADGAVGAPVVARLQISASGPFQITGVTYTDGTSGIYQAGTTFTSATAVLQGGNTGHGIVVGALRDANNNPVNLVFADGTIAIYNSMTVAYARYNPAVSVAADGPAVAQINYANTKVADIYADGAVGAPDYTVAGLQFSAHDPLQISGVTYTDGTTGGFRAGTTFTSSTALLQTSPSGHGTIEGVLLDSQNNPANIVFADGSLAAFSPNALTTDLMSNGDDPNYANDIQKRDRGWGALTGFVMDGNGNPVAYWFQSGVVMPYQPQFPGLGWCISTYGIIINNNASPAVDGGIVMPLTDFQGNTVAYLYRDGQIGPVNRAIDHLILDNQNAITGVVFEDGSNGGYSSLTSLSGVMLVTSPLGHGPIVRTVLNASNSVIGVVYSDGSIGTPPDSYSAGSVLPTPFANTRAGVADILLDSQGNPLATVMGDGSLQPYAACSFTAAGLIPSGPANSSEHIELVLLNNLGQPVGLVYQDGTIAAWPSSPLPSNSALNFGSSTSPILRALLGVNNTILAYIHQDGTLSQPSPTNPNLSNVLLLAPASNATVIETIGTLTLYSDGSLGTSTANAALSPSPYSAMGGATHGPVNGIAPAISGWVTYADGTVGPFAKVSAANAITPSGNIVGAVPAANGSLAFLIYQNGAVISAPGSLPPGTGFTTSYFQSGHGGIVNLLTPTVAVLADGTLLQIVNGGLQDGSTIDFTADPTGHGAIASILYSRTSQPIAVVMADGVLCPIGAIPSAMPSLINVTNPQIIGVTFDQNGNIASVFYSDGSQRAGAVTQALSAPRLVSADPSLHGPVKLILSDANGNPAQIVYADGTLASYGNGLPPGSLIDLATDDSTAATRVLFTSSGQVAAVQYADGHVGQPSAGMTTTVQPAGPVTGLALGRDNSVIGAVYGNGALAPLPANLGAANIQFVSAPAAHGAIIGELTNGGTGIGLIYADGRIGPDHRSGGGAPIVKYNTSEGVVVFGGSPVSQPANSVDPVIASSSSTVTFADGGSQAYSGIANGTLLTYLSPTAALGNFNGCLYSATSFTPICLSYDNGFVQFSQLNMGVGSGNSAADGKIVGVDLNDEDGIRALVYADGTTGAFSPGAVTAANTSFVLNDGTHGAVVYLLLNPADGTIANVVYADGTLAAYQPVSGPASVSFYPRDCTAAIKGILYAKDGSPLGVYYADGSLGQFRQVFATLLTATPSGHGQIVGINPQNGEVIYADGAVGCPGALPNIASLDLVSSQTGHGAVIQTQSAAGTTVVIYADGSIGAPASVNSVGTGQGAASSILVGAGLGADNTLSDLVYASGTVIAVPTSLPGNQTYSTDATLAGHGGIANFLTSQIAVMADGSLANIGAGLSVGTPLDFVSNPSAHGSISRILYATDSSPLGVVYADGSVGQFASVPLTAGTPGATATPTGTIVGLVLASDNGWEADIYANGAISKLASLLQFQTVSSASGPVTYVEIPGLVVYADGSVGQYGAGIAPGNFIDASAVETSRVTGLLYSPAGDAVAVTYQDGLVGAISDIKPANIPVNSASAPGLIVGVQLDGNGAPTAVVYANGTSSASAANQTNPLSALQLLANIGNIQFDSSATGHGAVVKVLTLAGGPYGVIYADGTIGHYVAADGTVGLPTIPASKPLLSIVIQSNGQLADANGQIWAVFDNGNGTTTTALLDSQGPLDRTKVEFSSNPGLQSLGTLSDAQGNFAQILSNGALVALPGVIAANGAQKYNNPPAAAMAVDPGVISDLATAQADFAAILTQAGGHYVNAALTSPSGAGLMSIWAGPAFLRWGYQMSSNPGSPKIELYDYSHTAAGFIFGGQFYQGIQLATSQIITAARINGYANPQDYLNVVGASLMIAGRGLFYGTSTPSTEFWKRKDGWANWLLQNYGDSSGDRSLWQQVFQARMGVAGNVLQTLAFTLTGVASILNSQQADNPAQQALYGAQAASYFAGAAAKVSLFFNDYMKVQRDQAALLVNSLQTWIENLYNDLASASALDAPRIRNSITALNRELTSISSAQATGNQLRLNGPLTAAGAFTFLQGVASTIYSGLLLDQDNLSSGQRAAIQAQIAIDILQMIGGVASVGFLGPASANWIWSPRGGGSRVATPGGQAMVSRWQSMLGQGMFARYQVTPAGVGNALGVLGFIGSILNPLAIQSLLDMENNADLAQQLVQQFQAVDQSNGYQGDQLLADILQENWNASASSYIVNAGSGIAAAALMTAVSGPAGVVIEIVAAAISAIASALIEGISPAEARARMGNGNFTEYFQRGLDARFAYYFQNSGQSLQTALAPLLSNFAQIIGFLELTPDAAMRQLAEYTNTTSYLPSAALYAVSLLNNPGASLTQYNFNVAADGSITVTSDQRSLLLTFLTPIMPLLTMAQPGTMKFVDFAPLPQMPMPPPLASAGVVGWRYIDASLSTNATMDVRNYIGYINFSTTAWSDGSTLPGLVVIAGQMYSGHTYVAPLYLKSGTGSSTVLAGLGMLNIDATASQNLLVNYNMLGGNCSIAVSPVTNADGTFGGYVVRKTISDVTLSYVMRSADGNGFVTATAAHVSLPAAVNDIINLGGTDNASVAFYGTPGNDSFIGGSENNYWYASAGLDSYVGGAGVTNTVDFGLTTAQQVATSLPGTGGQINLLQKVLTFDATRYANLQNIILPSWDVYVQANVAMTYWAQSLNVIFDDRSANGGMTFVGYNGTPLSGRSPSIGRKTQIQDFRDSQAGNDSFVGGVGTNNYILLGNNDSIIAGSGFNNIYSDSGLYSLNVQGSAGPVDVYPLSAAPQGDFSATLARASTAQPVWAGFVSYTNAAGSAQANNGIAASWDPDSSASPNPQGIITVQRGTVTDSLTGVAQLQGSAGNDSFTLNTVRCDILGSAGVDSYVFNVSQNTVDYSQAQVSSLLIEDLADYTVPTGSAVPSQPTLLYSGAGAASTAVIAPTGTTIAPTGTITVTGIDAPDLFIGDGSYTINLSAGICNVISQITLPDPNNSAASLTRPGSGAATFNMGGGDDTVVGGSATNQFTWISGDSYDSQKTDSITGGSGINNFNFGWGNLSDRITISHTPVATTNGSSATDSSNFTFNVPVASSQILWFRPSAADAANSSTHDLYALWDNSTPANPGAGETLLDIIDGQNSALQMTINYAGSTPSSASLAQAAAGAGTASWSNLSSLVALDDQHLSSGQPIANDSVIGGLYGKDRITALSANFLMG